MENTKEYYGKYHEYLNETIGKSIPIHTNELIQFIRYNEFYTKDLNIIKMLLEKYNIPNYIIIQSQFDDCKHLEYFADFYRYENKMILKYNQIEKDLHKYSLFDGYVVDLANYDLSNLDIYIKKVSDKNFKISEKDLLCNRYYIFNNRDINQIQDIINYLKIKTKLYKEYDLVNKELDIYGLTVLLISETINFCNEYQFKDSILYKLNSLLLETRIQFSFIDDFQDKTKLSSFIGNIYDNRKVNWYFRKDLKTVFKSSYEANIARILNYKGIPWEYEKKHIAYETLKGISYYLPDFFIPNNTIIEVKGFWDYISRKTIVSFLEKNTDYKLLIIDNDMMYTLNNLYSSIVNHWENEKIFIKKEIVPIYGINRKDRLPHVEKLKTNNRLIFEREPDNSFDPNAIKALNHNGDLIGYMAAHWCFIYAQKIDLGMKFETEIVKIESQNIKVKVTRTNIEENIVHDILQI